MIGNQMSADLRRCCDALSASNEKLKEENKRLRDALDNLLKVHEGVGGTKFPADEIARAALAQEQGEKHDNQD